VALSFAPGDNLVFQIESGYGLIRVLAMDNRNDDVVWHVLVYEEFFPDVESAETALNNPTSLSVRAQHLALTNRALGKTPAARLSNTPVTEGELGPYHEWVQRGGQVSDRSVLLMLGIR
jgi:hypothetical protein